MISRRGVIGSRTGLKIPGPWVVRVRVPSPVLKYAVCPGSEGAVLKTVDQKWFAGANPVDGAKAHTANILCV